ncbi:chaperonin 10-like protein [Infundibulicybe gibba]|nr:chaperonin 10-like protein [Infundibulicybe gibba]
MESPAIPATAPAAVLHKVGGEYVLAADHPVKQPSELKPDECLIRLEYSGVCHSDLHIKKGDWGRDPILPLVGGHEGVGHVVAMGKNSTEELVKIGDRVGVKWIADACLRCEMCMQGSESSCLTSFVRSHGFMVHGTFSQYVVSYTKYVTPIPEGLHSAAATPILCAGLTIYKALKQTNAKAGDWVSISGAGGGLGHLGVQYAVAMGFRVLAIDTGAAKKELCLRLGAEQWVDFLESKDLVKDVQAATGGSGPQAAVVAAGDAKPFNQALTYIRFTGTLVVVGMPGKDAILSVPINFLVSKSATIVGTAIGNRKDMAEALQLAAHGKVQCQYEVKELKDLNSVLDDLEGGRVAGRVVLKL